MPLPPRQIGRRNTLGAPVGFFDDGGALFSPDFATNSVDAVRRLAVKVVVNVSSNWPYEIIEHQLLL